MTVSHNHPYVSRANVVLASSPGQMWYIWFMHFVSQQYCPSLYVNLLAGSFIHPSLHSSDLIPEKMFFKNFDTNIRIHVLLLAL